MVNTNQLSSKLIIIACLAALLVLGGCSGFGKGGSSGPSASAPQGPMPVYYDFEDVLIPKELKVNNNESFVYTTAGLTAGVIALKGRVDAKSLIAFFENSMPKDGWAQISAFKSPRTMLLFRKESRWCAINITEQSFKTIAEIWVSPTQEGGASGLLKQ